MANPNQPGGRPTGGQGQKPGGQKPGQPGTGSDWQNPKRQQNPGQPQRPNKNPDQR